MRERGNSARQIRGFGMSEPKPLKLGLGLQHVRHTHYNRKDAMNLLFMATWLALGIGLTQVIADYTLREDRDETTY